MNTTNTTTINRTEFLRPTSSTGQGRPHKTTMRHRDVETWNFGRWRLDRPRSRRPEGGVLAVLEGVR